MFHELVEEDSVARDFKGKLLERVVIEAARETSFKNKDIVQLCQMVAELSMKKKKRSLKRGKKFW